LFLSIDTYQYYECSKLSRTWRVNTIQLPWGHYENAFNENPVEMKVCCILHLHLYESLWDETISLCVAVSGTSNSLFCFVFLVLPFTYSWTISKNWSSLKDKTKIKETLVWRNILSW
jgi:hypothetical protein